MPLSRSDGTGASPAKTELPGSAKAAEHAIAATAKNTDIAAAFRTIDLTDDIVYFFFTSKEGLSQTLSPISPMPWPWLRMRRILLP